MSDAERFFRTATGIVRTGIDDDTETPPDPLPSPVSGSAPEADDSPPDTVTIEVAARWPMDDAGHLADVRGVWRQSRTPGDPVRGWLRRDGWDAIAYYRPYHASPDTWGIHFRLDRLFALEAKVLGAGLPRYAVRDWTAPQPDAFADICELVTHHELLHFRTEFALTHLEVATDRRLFAAYSEWYRDTRGTSASLEEALATATKFREGRAAHPELVELLEEWTKKAPRGYKNDGPYGSDDGYQDGLRALVATMLRGSWPRTGEILERDVTRAYEDSVPRYVELEIHAGPSRPWLVQFVVPSQVRTLPIRKVEAHAMRLGATIETGRGGHGTNLIFDGRHYPLPKHGGRNEVIHYQIKELAELFRTSRDEFVIGVLDA